VVKPSACEVHAFVFYSSLSFKCPGFEVSVFWHKTFGYFCCICFSYLRLSESQVYFEEYFPSHYTICVCHTRWPRPVWHVMFVCIYICNIICTHTYIHTHKHTLTFKFMFLSMDFIGHSPFLFNCTFLYGVRGGLVGIGTGYRLDCPGVETRWGRDFLHLFRTALKLASLLLSGYRVFPGDKATVVWRSLLTLILRPY
jgi:hypothetical protein